MQVDVDGEKKIVLIQIGEIESVTFDFEGPEWENGFFFCVGGCRGAVLTLVFSSSFCLFKKCSIVQQLICLE